ncbi:MAG: ABC transporter substrate-binding protein [Desulfobacca sp.]|nr:ABC transporter substrate-binding protein [Desulfobacca sp.]
MKKHVLAVILWVSAVAAGLVLPACQPQSGGSLGGAFGVRELGEGRQEIVDGVGRRFLLVPEGKSALPGYPPTQIITIPVKRVGAGLPYDIGAMRYLGVLSDSLVGVIRREDRWASADVRAGIRSGKIAYLGEPNGIDYERLRVVSPDVMLTSDKRLLPKLDELKIPAIITTTPMAMTIEERLQYFYFLAALFGREEMAKQYEAVIQAKLAEVKKQTTSVSRKPKVIWGDIYQKRVLVEPMNSYVAQLVEVAGGDYLFDDVRGASCLEITLERFFSSGLQADIFFTYRSPAVGIDSKQKLITENPRLADIKPFKTGLVYCPQPHFYESLERLDDIIVEIAAILHPQLYQGYELQFFQKLD